MSCREARGGPGIICSDLLMNNKIDLTLCRRSLMMMAKERLRLRKEKPYIFTNKKTGQGVDRSIQFIERRGI